MVSYTKQVAGNISTKYKTEKEGKNTLFETYAYTYFFTLWLIIMCKYSSLASIYLVYCLYNLFPCKKMMYNTERVDFLAHVKVSVKYKKIK